MSTFRIPNSTGQIVVSDRSETTGQILESFSININNPFGKIKPSNKLVKVLDETDLDDSRLQALAVYKRQGSSAATYYYAVATGYVSVCPTTQDPTDATNWRDINDAFAGIFSADNLGEESDAVVFNDLLLMSRSQDILSWNGSTEDPDWWTTVALGGETGPSLTAGVPHTMHVHKGGLETLFVTNENLVHYANTESGHSTITLAADQVATCLTSGVDAIWAGTYSTSSDSAYVYEIFIGQVSANSTPIANRAFKIDGRAVLSMEVIDNIPYIITDRGNLQVFTGAGFKTIQRLPFAATSSVLDGMRIGNIDKDNTQRPVHPKGMRADNGSLFININTETDNIADNLQDPMAKKTASGVWEYNSDTRQLHHRFTFANAATNNGSELHNFTGPLMIVDSPYTFLMAGAEIHDTTSGLFMETNSKYGYFITPEILSEVVQDAYTKLFIKATNAGTINVKYRLKKKADQFATVTLANANTINTTDTLSVEVGDEVTIIDGSLHGAVAHITAVDTSATVTSMTLDTDIGTAGNTGTAEITNFKKFSKQYTSDSEYEQWGSTEVNPWIQYKVEMIGDLEIRDFISNGKANTNLG